MKHENEIVYKQYHSLFVLIHDVIQYQEKNTDCIGEHPSFIQDYTRYIFIMDTWIVVYTLL